MGMVAATLANGGTLYRPQLIAGIRHPGDEHFTHSSPEVANELNWDRWMVSAIKAGMEDVVMTDEGSAKAGRIEGFRYAGKTGTAQFGQRGNTIYRCWMIAYAPADNPQYAVSLMVEEGDGSATDAVPRMKRVMEGIFFGGDGMVDVKELRQRMLSLDPVMLVMTLALMLMGIFFVYSAGYEHDDRRFTINNRLSGRSSD